MVWFIFDLTWRTVRGERLEGAAPEGMRPEAELGRCSRIPTITEWAHLTGTTRVSRIADFIVASSLLSRLGGCSLQNEMIYSELNSRILNMWEEIRVFRTVSQSHVFTHLPHSLLSLVPLLLFLRHILHLLLSSSPTPSLVHLSVYTFLVLCHILSFVFLLPFNPTFHPLLLLPIFLPALFVSIFDLLVIVLLLLLKLLLPLY